MGRHIWQSHGVFGIDTVASYRIHCSHPHSLLVTPVSLVEGVEGQTRSRARVEQKIALLRSIALGPCGDWQERAASWR